jgi:hypothetical protein
MRCPATAAVLFDRTIILRTSACLLAVVAAACTGTAVLTQRVEARRLAAEIRVQFAKASDAANRAVMSDTDEGSAAAAQEAEAAAQAVLRDVNLLHPILQSLGYPDEIRALDAFTDRFAEFRTLDGEILPLAVENTNLKAQRLSFGPARDASRSFREALDAAAKSAALPNRIRAEALASQAGAAMLEIQVIEARHIAEPDDAAMTQMEAEMSTLETTLRDKLGALTAIVPGDGPHLRAADSALERFKGHHAEIIGLSRRNTNVRSLALSLGRKRIVTAACDDHLRALVEALAKHEFRATR